MQRLSTLTNVLEQQQKADALVALAVSRDSRWSVDPIEAFVTAGTPDMRASRRRRSMPSRLMTRAWRSSLDARRT